MSGDGLHFGKSATPMELLLRNVLVIIQERRYHNVKMLFRVLVPVTLEKTGNFYLELSAQEVFFRGLKGIIPGNYTPALHWQRTTGVLFSAKHW